MKAVPIRCQQEHNFAADPVLARPRTCGVAPAAILWGMDMKTMFSGNTTRVAGGSKLEADTILSHWSSFVILLAIVAVYYLFLLSNGTFQLFAPETLDKTFDNMLVHLLHGDFTVDRAAIGYEAFTRDGKTYAYFGIFPALLRLLAMPFTDVGQAHLARLSCLSAVVIFVALQLRMLLIVHRSLPPPSRRSEFLAVMVAATVLSGPQLYLLALAWVYDEAVLWSAVLAAAFNLVIVRTAFDAKYLRGRDLALLAGLAGLAVNTRPTIGVALYLGTILLVGWTAWCRYAPAAGAQRSLIIPTRFSSIIIPIAILGLFAVVAGIVNFERWGNPFTFANFHYWDMRVDVYPNTVEILRKYGEFNIGRIWIGALYYTTDLPYLLHTVPPFAGFLRDRLQIIESPPITPVLTNPLTMVLVPIGLYRVWWRPDPSTRGVTILRLALLGHASAVLLILAAMALLQRYRFDFAPFMTLAILVGFASISTAMTAAPEPWRKRVSITAIGLCVLGILFSHYELLLYKVYGWTVPMNVRLTLLPFAPFAHYVLGR
jgi:hypothetical protein